jgi:hypothetical protein
MKQSDKTKPFSIIEKKGKITLMIVIIEWNGVFDRLSIFANSNFVQLKDVVLNGNQIADYLYKN